jgi:hypothetical protein
MMIARVLALVLLTGSVVTAQSLPEIPSYKLTLFTHATMNAYEKELLAAFDKQPLKDVKDNTTWNHYTEADNLFKERFNKYVDKLPTVWLHRADGGVVYKASEKNIPGYSFGSVEPKAIFDEMRYYFKLDPYKIQGREDAPDSVEYNEQACPDGMCPLPDSVDMINRVTPVRDAMSSVVWMVGGVVGFMVLMMLGVLALGVLFIVAKVIKEPKNGDVND